MEVARWYYLEVDGDRETERGPLLSNNCAN